MKKVDMKDQKAYVNKNTIAKSDHACSDDSNCRENVTHDQNYIKKIGVRNPHPWSLIGMR